ncbi:hypothetical protein [Vibrio sp. PNB22_4_1]
MRVSTSEHVPTSLSASERVLEHVPAHLLARHLIVRRFLHRDGKCGREWFAQYNLACKRQFPALAD